jgi:ankyrin repeat protein
MKNISDIYHCKYRVNYLVSAFLWVIILFSVSCVRNKPAVKIDSGMKPASSAAEETTKGKGTDNLLVKEIEIAGNIQGGSIHDAAIKGDSEKLRELLEKDPRCINQRHLMNYGRGPLHYAVIYGRREAVEFLLSKGAEIDMMDADHGRTPLHYASITGHADIVEILFRKGVNLNEGDKYGWTPLHHSAINGNSDIIDLLLSKGAKVDAVDETGKTSLHYAVTYGHHGSAQKLIEAGGDVNRTDDEGRTPLHYAVRWKSSDETILMLINKGAKLNIKDKQGMTPLMTAKIQENKEAERILSSEGAKDEPVAKAAKAPDVAEEPGYFDTTVGNKVLSPPEKAIMRGEKGEELIRILSGVKDVNNIDNMGLTLIHKGIMYGSIDSVKYLASQGGDLNVRDKSGKTPLHYCAVYGLKDLENIPTKGGVCLEIAKFLLSKGVDVNAADKDGRTPLHYAASRVMTELLISGGSNVKAKDRNGWTPLHWSAMQGFLEITKTLVEHGAEVNAIDGDGKTPMDAAAIEWRKDEGHSDVANYLRKHGGIKTEKKDDDD